MRVKHSDAVERLTRLCLDIAEVYDPALRKMPTQEMYRGMDAALTEFGFIAALKDLISEMSVPGALWSHYYTLENDWYKRAIRSIRLERKTIQPALTSEEQSFAYVVERLLHLGKENILRTMQSIIMTELKVPPKVRDRKDQMIHDLTMSTCNLQHGRCIYLIVGMLLREDREIGVAKGR